MRDIAEIKADIEKAKQCEIRCNNHLCYPKGRLVGGEVRLENDDLGWIEITEDDFEEGFEEVAKQ